ncbi:MAG: hypothetical protein GF405_09950 [Candidatus Eisenbacteria bacterium]|nr:hypothetical protein [Candidatus Eisenbacteria bacterium]
MTRLRRLSLTVLFVAAALGAAIPVSADIPEHAEEITTHLEFNGYTAGEEDGWLTFSHPERLSFTMQTYQGGILLQSWFGGTEYAGEHPGEFHTVVNSMNAGATTMRLYVDNDGDLAMEAWYPGTYDKETFSSFLDAWEDDGATLLGSHYDALSHLVE